MLSYIQELTNRVIVACATAFHQHFGSDVTSASLRSTDHAGSEPHSLVQRGDTTQRKHGTSVDFM